MDEVLVVGNEKKPAFTDPYWSLAFNSSRGENTEFDWNGNMPGKPDIVAPGETINMASAIGSTTSVVARGGTSYAAPYVAGMAALYSANTGATALATRDAIISTSRLLDTVSDGIESGAGIVNAHKMLWNGSTWDDGIRRIAIRGSIGVNAPVNDLTFKAPNWTKKGITFISRSTRTSDPSVTVNYRFRLQKQNTCDGAWTTVRDVSHTARQYFTFDESSGNPCWWAHSRGQSRC